MNVIHMTQALGWMAAIRTGKDEVVTKSVVMWAFVENEAEGRTEKEFVGVLENAQYGLAIMDRGDNFIGYYPQKSSKEKILEDAEERGIPFEFDEESDE